MSNLWHRSVYNMIRKIYNFLPIFFYTFFCVFFFLFFYFLSQDSKKGEREKKKDTRSSSMWGESIKTWQCCKMQWEMENGKSSEQQHETMRKTAAGGVGEVMAGVALRRWLIPSSISTRSNCWTLLNMTYLWSASCDTKGKLHSENGWKSAVIILPFSVFFLLLFPSFFPGI